MSEGHTEISEERIYFFEKQAVTVLDFDASGFILDIGGGGEGIIGQLKGQQVVAIDPSRRELVGAAEGPLKIVMDARELLFLDKTFEVVTSFFTLMYIKARDHAQVFGEVFRVLVSGGRFLVWDVDLPCCMAEDKDIAAFPLSVNLPAHNVETGYGVLWPEQEQGLSYYVGLAERAGFEVAKQRMEGRVLYLELHKP